MKPILESRTRVRSLLKSSMLGMGSPRKLWESNANGLRNEGFFTRGHDFRERNDGRIDMRVNPSQAAFRDPELLVNPFAFPILLKLLGEKLELKSMHAIQALPFSEGASRKPQHWHRDTGLLFPNDGHFHISDVHNKTGGLHLPPYAINQFVQLVNASKSNGPTEFSLGSHQWGTKWIDDEAEGVVDASFYVKEGSVILMDYRTVHRGTVNKSPARRPMGMLIWGRDWWSDSINYPSSCGPKMQGHNQGLTDSLIRTMREKGALGSAVLAIDSYFDTEAKRDIVLNYKEDNQSTGFNRRESDSNRISPCGTPSLVERRANYFRICVNGWGESLAQELRDLHS